MSERFISPCKPPEGRERELLEILIEECAEVQQRATKALRFGLKEVQPGQNLNNIERMSEELGDVFCVLEHCKKADLLCADSMDSGHRRKERQLRKFMQSEPPHDQ